ncbi:MAG TPA: proline dehydrogenase family protein [Propionibacteriaceae bacterium]|nr:proline dehydrogenase family protein [Propionibacteriaceae bacterium]
MLRRLLLGLSHNDTVKSAVLRMPVSATVVARYVAGDSTCDAVTASRQLEAAGLSVSIDYLGEDTTDRQRADAVTTTYRELLAALHACGLTGSAEVSVKLSALGLVLPRGGPELALGNARTICEAARDVGTTVTLDMEDHTTTDATLQTLRELRADFPSTAAVLQAYLRRTEADCKHLATAGSRVRLCKGAYDEPSSVAYQQRAEVDRSYVRCLKILMSGPGYPMVATHDPRLIAIGTALAEAHHRSPRTYEFQMLYGIRPTEQQRLANLGHTVRVYLPYGTDWYGYLVRRLAERPANLAFFLRSLLTRS